MLKQQEVHLLNENLFHPNGPEACTENLLNLVFYNLPHQLKRIQLFDHDAVTCCWSIAEVVKPFKNVRSNYVFNYAI